MENKGLPIAENFHSLQGEGTYVGTPMHFIRLAGCPVGKAASKDFNLLPVLSNKEVGSYCRTWDGRTFECDTDFSCHTYKTVDELIGETWEKHICLTGGEPLIHQNVLIGQEFFMRAFQKGIKIHIETSGTVMLDRRLHDDNRVWVTVAPKWDYKREMIHLADEVKLLVDKDFNLDPLMRDTLLDKQVFVSPINGEKEINFDNVQRCLEILWDHPTWRLSAQFHKLLNLR